jgi:GNAT superfamily N-acetyltransferase
MIRVRVPALSEEELYLNTWKMAQVDSPWSRYTGPFAPNPEDELNAARAALRDPASKCWIAIEDGNAAGVLACGKVDEMARLGSGDREPAVLPHYRQTSAGMKLLDAAFGWSTEGGLAGIFAILKLPPDVDPRAQWHTRLYFQWGMALTRLVVELGTGIHETKVFANPNVEFRGGCDVDPDLLCDIVLHSFESTKAFEYDPLVHDPDEARAFVSGIRKDEGLYVAYLGDEPVGFVYARAPATEGREYGHIAAIGTVPERSGQRIGTSLLQRAHDYIIDKGYERSFVGTSECNMTSLALYRKMGYRPAYRILKFVKVARAVDISRDLIPHDFEELRPLEQF